MEHHTISIPPFACLRPQSNTHTCTCIVCSEVEFTRFSSVPVLNPQYCMIAHSWEHGHLCLPGHALQCSVAGKGAIREEQVQHDSVRSLVWMLGVEVPLQCDPVLGDKCHPKVGWWCGEDCGGQEGGEGGREGRGRNQVRWGEKGQMRFSYSAQLKWSYNLV